LGSEFQKRSRRLSTAYVSVGANLGDKIANCRRGLSLLNRQAGTEVVVAPIPGLILDIKVAAGDSVSAGQVVAVMEAMKMENNLVSNVSGTVQEIRVQKGAEVSTGDVIMLIG
jgi:biotin carboxyl carrier protein